MNKIPKSDKNRKRAASPRVKLVRGGLGYVVKGQTNKPNPNRHALEKREKGDIQTFSRASQRRLRETLALGKLASGETAHIWGVTLTIPGPELSADAVRDLWGAFVDGMRAFQDVPIVWRIELQTRADRRQAHWHCVLWVAGDELASRVQAVQIVELWRRVVLDRVSALPRRTLAGFFRHGVDLKSLDGASATGLVGYLCDHASKHKQEQLGWVGRQWGVVNRHALDLGGVEVCKLSQREHKQAARQYRRLQEHLRRDGVYTGVRVTPGGNVSKAIFGRDALRFLACAKYQERARAAVGSAKRVARGAGVGGGTPVAPPPAPPARGLQSKQPPHAEQLMLGLSEIASDAREGAYKRAEFDPIHSSTDPLKTSWRRNRKKCHK